MAIVTVDEVRAITGVKVDITDDDTIITLIDLAESNTREKFRINTSPKVNIDILEANTNRQLLLRRQNPLKILSLDIGTRSVPVNTLYLDYTSGLISFKSGSTERLFVTSANERVKVKYLNAFITKDEDFIQETTVDAVAGDSVDVTVDDGTEIDVDEYWMFEDLEGSVEVAKVTGKNVNVITFDKLVNNYVAGSLITFIKPNETLRQFVLYESAVSTARNAVGGSYTFNTSYTMEGVTTNLGIPYPHFEKMLNSNMKERDRQYAVLQNKLIHII